MIALYDRTAQTLNASADSILPTLARFVFAATLMFYFWNSGLTKFDGSPFTPGVGGYAQIFPKAMEAVAYDISQMSIFHWAVVVAGTLAEFILPFLIVIGLFTRFAAFGMIGFVIVQSLTDLYGHGGIEHAETLGAWFDGLPTGTILDQRAFWVLLLVTLVLKGAGPLSVDRLLSRNR
ncbi:DoxX family protein [Octadecabacter sp. G9-8]|uniref:DoxX family protein n=1 Tax=Octadecabacter dasysiphoniae TaxID=2909341 RepID=A0ABS9CS99_9RHOB|nr:DoxX family protein [Octadecabacter dasysiphoniae]MCF2870102.1 DoxX family protein [Octadecabacter dasysiphoniae]